MRPDKKKKYRGKQTDKSEETQGQSKNAVSKVPEKEETPKPNITESNEKVGNTDKTKSTATSSSASVVSTENLPPANLRRETDALKETKKPSKRQIFSDWKEYDKPILPEEIQEEQLHDFASLIQQSITEDNYFKFKHERQWENDTCNINKDLFNLNLQELSLGLQCIPFYERLNVSKELFTDHELKRMENCAKQQEKLYEEFKIQQAERSDKAEEEDLKLEIASDRGSSRFENELIKCLTRERQDNADETSSIQPKESEVKGSQFDFFNDNGKPVIEENAREDNIIENKPEQVKEERNRLEETNISSHQNSTTIPPCDFFNDNGKPVMEENARKGNIIENKPEPIKKENDSLEKTNITITSSPIIGSEVKPGSNEVMAESVVKPSEDTPLEASTAESGSIDMATVFESEPLGQRKKPQRSRESKTRSKPKVVNSGEEEQILDSLLSLKEPTIVADDSKKKEIEEVENEAEGLTNDLKSIVIHDKEENLEAWLDSMLDD